MDPLLNINDLTIDFKVKNGLLRAVDGLNLTVHKGVSIGIVGESGCGKTVTAYSILKLLPETAIVKGKISFQQIDLLSLSEEGIRNIRGKKISMIFQEPESALNPVFTIGTQIIEAIRTHKHISKNSAKELAIEIFKSVGLPNPEEAIKKYPHELSGGLKQRALIGIALSTEPEILIADEPTTALDVTIQAQILALLNELKVKRDLTIILISHDFGVVSEIADMIYVMYAGWIVESAYKINLFKNPLHPYTKSLLKAIPDVNFINDGRRPPLFSIPGNVPDMRFPPTGCRFKERCQYAFERCKEKPVFFQPYGEHNVRCFLYEK